MKQYIKHTLFPLLILLCLYGCQDESMHSTKVRFTTYKVAVIYPEEMHERFKRVAEWAMKEIEKSQTYLEQGIRLELHWYDENTIDMQTTITQLINNKEIVAIIGPYHSSNVKVAANCCKDTQKTLILPTASSAELQRAYAGKGFTWFLSESDITQCEMLLIIAIEHNAKRVSLLAKEDSYGNSFIDWFAFQAGELGLEIGNIYTYTAENINSKIEEIGRSNIDALICAPSTADDVVAINKSITQFIKNTQTIYPHVFFSDIACSKAVSNKLDDNTLFKMEGVIMCADPSSGFNIAYKIRYDEEPLSGEAHLFDAISLLSYGLFKMQHAGTNNLNQALISVVDGRDANSGSWMQSDMANTFQMLANGLHPNLHGAIGSWDFDSKVHTSVTKSVYAFWSFYNQEYTLISYLSSDGSKRTESTLAGWNWRTDRLQEFDKNAKDKTYPPLNDKWAVLVATSQGWANYRHQADVLAMYDLLKRHGYQDSHIILIMQDDIAYNPKNPYQGVVCVTPAQIEQNMNLHAGVKTDYHTNDLNPTDLKEILSGKSSERLPQVIHPGPNDDILVFWSGHGEKGGSLNWGEYKTLRNYEAFLLFQELGKAHQYRKMLVVIEACYSGGLADYCTNAPDVLFITAANAYETSKADIFNEKMGIYMSNGFTRGFQEAIDSNPNISLRDLYYKLARNTVGSHVTIYNEKEFGNLYKSSMSDFLN